MESVIDGFSWELEDNPVPNLERDVNCFDEIVRDFIRLEELCCEVALSVMVDDDVVSELEIAAERSGVPIEVIHDEFYARVWLQRHGL